MSDTNKIPIAMDAALGHLRLVKPLYDDVNEKYNHAKDNGKPLGIRPGELSPLIVNVSFAIELLLKILTIQDTMHLPRKSHNLKVMFDKLDKDVRLSVESRYAHFLNEFRGGKEAPYVAYNMSQFDGKINTDPSPTFQKAIKRLNGCFEKWRYMHELENNPNGLLYFSFLDSRCVTHALEQEILNFQGELTVSYKSI